MKATFKKLALGFASLALVLSSGLAVQAHAPEKHLDPLPAYQNKTLCELKFESYKTLEDVGFCDPNNPQNLFNGINKNSHPDGLCYPAFNAYTDEVEVDTGWGMDPYGTIPPLFGDERNFVKAIKFKPGKPWLYMDMGDSVKLEEGDIVQVFMYMHNDGNPCFNENVNIPAGKFFSNWNTTSRNTKISFTPDFQIENGKAFFDLDNPKVFLGSIWSDNAVGETGVVGGKTTDGVYFDPQEEGLRLELIPEKTYYVDMVNDSGFEWWAFEHEVANQLDIFRENGFQISTLKNQDGDLKGDGGDFYASEPYIALMRFRFEVTKQPTPPPKPEPVCKSLDVDMTQDSIAGKTTYVFDILDIEFENQVPVDLKYRYTSLDPNGKFFVLPNTSTPYESVEAFITQKVVYQGNGPVNVSVVGYENTCQEQFVIPVKDLTCDELDVNYHSTIFTDQISRFNAKAINAEDEMFNGMITYTVEPGYGQFFLYKPTTHLDNETDIIVEFDETEAIVTPQGGFCGGYSPTPGGPTPDPNGGFNFDPNAEPDFENPYLDDIIDIIGEDLTKPSNPYIPEAGTNNNNNNSEDDDQDDPFYFNPITDLVIDVALWEYFNTPDEEDEDDPNQTITPATPSIIGPQASSAIQAEKELIDALKEMTEVPDWWIDGIFIDPGIVDPSPIEASNGIDEGNLFEPALNSTGMDETIQSGGLVENLDIYNEPYQTSASYKGPQQNLTPTPTDFGLNNVLIDIQPKTIDPKILQTLLQGQNKVTVAPGTPVYFVGTKAGEDKIKVDTECTDDKECTRYFDIEASPLDCEASTLKIVEAGTKSTPLCLETGSKYNMSHDLFVDKEKTQKLSDSIVEIKWETTDPKGKFIDMRDQPDFTINDAPYIGSPFVQYQGGGKVTSTLYSIDGELVSPNNVCKQSIDACEDDNKCANLSILSSDGSPIEIAEVKQGNNPLFTVAGLDLQGKLLPGETKLKWSTDTNGQLTFIPNGDDTPVKGQSLDLYLKNVPVIFSEGPQTLQAGTIEVTMDPSDPLYSPSCKASIPVVDQLVCKDLTVTITEEKSGEQVTELKPNSVYIVSASANYSGPYENKIKYTIDKGWFYTGSLPILDPADAFTQTVELADGESVKLLTKNIETDDTDTLRVQAKGFFNNACDKTFGIKVVNPPEENDVCIDLDITRPDDWEVDEDEDEDDRKQLFEIDVTTSPSSYDDELTIHWEVTDGDGSWDNGDNDEKETTQGVYKNYLYDFSDDAEVEIWASHPGSNSKINACSDDIEVDVEDEDDDDEPKIDKLIYPKNEVDEADDFMNIGDKDLVSYVTYAIQFEVGSADSVRIYDEDLINGEIDGDFGGHLEFEGMRINVLDEKGNDGKYTVLKTDGYRDNKDGDKYLGDDEYDEDGNSDDIDDYEDDYRCGEEKDKSRICIEGPFDDAVEDFKDKDGYIEFQNLQELGKDGAIIIKYQMRNESEVNEDTCKNEISPSKGCGEKFPNEAEYRAWTSDEPSGNPDFEDGAQARTVVLCPFVLKRQGGDTFFHDEFDTGIDVSQCSEVKDDDGVGVTPEKNEKKEISNTGAGELFENQELILELPSHDICQFSNLNTNLEGYDNVLKNFSSTICELRAEVAEDWKETNITASINANINLIAAWNKNLNGINKLTTNNMPSSSNGIYMKNDGKDLTLDFDGAIPSEGSAAKTIIVRDADLYIDSNILYPDLDPEDALNPKNFPSLAIIVLDGDIHIASEVTEIHAAIISLDTDGEGNDGRVLNNPDETTGTLLNIHGNLIGNVQKLFEKRKGVGDPRKNQGSVTIFFDQSIILNPPQGLSQLLDVSQLEAVN